MSTVNKAIIIGRLGRDPETRSTQGGTSVCNFSVATDERIKDGGEWTTRPEWHRVTVFDKLADACGKYLAKGLRVYVEGRLQTRKYTDRDGNERSTTEIIAREVVFLAHKNDGTGRSETGSPGGALNDYSTGGAPLGADDAPF